MCNGWVMQNSIDSIGSAEAAAQLQIDRSTLTRWVKAQKLIPILRGSGTTGEMFFDRADVDALSPTSPTSGESTPVTDNAPEASSLAGVSSSS